MRDTPCALRKLLVWAQECVARSRVFHDEVADRWDFGGLEDFDRFTEFMVRRKQCVIHLRDPRVHACDKRGAFAL